MTLKLRKIFIFCILLQFSINAYSFWIWSPKTQKWKNPKYSALATPYLQYKEAEKLYDGGDYKSAYKEFKKLLIHYPDSKEAAESQYFLAMCLEKFNKPYNAYVEYQKLIDSYPNSQRINEAVERIYGIGEYFLNREHKKLLGVSVYDFVDHPAIEIFHKLVDKVPYSDYAPRAQYKIGMILMELGRYDEARDAFQKTIDTYSDSEWSAPAKYQLAIATAKAFPGADYDSTYLAEATSRLDEFIKEHPEAQISSQAEEQLQKLRNKEARKIFEIGEFYEKQDKYASAVIYFKKVINNYPESSYYDSSIEKAKELNELIRQNLTRKQWEKQQKRSKSEEKRAEKIRKKETKQQEKQRRRDERKAAVEELKKIRMAESLKKIEDNKAHKQALRQEKLNKIREAKKRKDALRREKLEKIEKEKAKAQEILQEKLNKNEIVKSQRQRAVDEKKTKADNIRQEKAAKKEALREAKLKKAAEAKAKAEIIRQEKLRKKEEARLAKQKRVEDARARAEEIRQEKIMKAEEVKKARRVKAEIARVKAQEIRLEKLRKKEKARAAKDEKTKKIEKAELGAQRVNQSIDPVGDEQLEMEDIKQQAQEQIERIQKSIDSTSQNKSGAVKP